MDNYVNREQLIKTICQEYQGRMTSFLARPNDFVAMIENSPVLVLADKRHGHWERGNILYSIFGLAKCSACGFVNERTYFCPTCGAKMDVERKE